METDDYSGLVIGTGIVVGALVCGLGGFLIADKYLSSHKEEKSVYPIPQRERSNKLAENTCAECLLVQSKAIQQLSVVLGKMTENEEVKVPDQNSEDLFPQREHPSEDNNRSLANTGAPRSISPRRGVRVGELLQPTMSENELASIFEDEHQRQNRSIEQVLNVGRKAGSEPVKYYAQKGGGYVSMKQIKESKAKSKDFKKLSRADEIEIMHAFDHLRGINYYKAMTIAEEQGYELHPIYVNGGQKTKAVTYKGNILGISVKDSAYDPFKSEFSKKAIVTTIIDVGGQDEHNRGKIRSTN